METTSQIILELPPAKESRAGKLPLIISLLPLPLLIFLGLGGTLYSALGLTALPVNVMIPAITGVLACVAFSAFFTSGKSVFTLVSCVLGALLVYSIIFYAPLKNAWFMLVNQIMDTLCVRYGRIFPEFAVTASENSRALCAALLMVPLSLLLALAAGLIARSGSGVFAAAAILLIAAGIVSGFMDFSTWTLLLVMAALLSGYRSYSARRHADSGEGGVAAVFLTVAVLAVILALPLQASGLANRLSPAPLKRTVTSAAEFIRYGTPGTSMPDGDFRGLGPMVFRMNPALEITMSNPDSYYLRGYVGEAYTKTGWTSLKPSERAESAEVFFWLHRYAFYGQTQLSTLAGLVSENGGSLDGSTITVANISASPKYIYAPYELLLEDGAGLPDENAIGDGPIKAGGFSGQRGYTYGALPNQVKRYDILSDRLYDVQEYSEDVSRYLDSEKAYREFAYEQYTAVPEQPVRVLHTQLGDIGLAAGEHMPYQEAKQRIFSYLNENISYTNNPPAIRGDEDFLHALLERTRAGYSVHYATAAALMFRYFGIPARYIEGYLITPENAQDADENGTVTLTGENEHAWVEYYEDGIGWIPFEVTAPYAEVMESADTVSHDKSNVNNETGNENLETDANEGSGDESNEDEEPEKDEEAENVISPERTGFSLPLHDLILIFAALLLIALVVMQIIRRRAAIKKLRAKLDSSDHRAAICSILPYSMNLLCLSGLEKKNGSLETLKPDMAELFNPDTCTAFTECIEIHREAQFSNREMSGESADILRAFMSSALKELKVHRNLFQRFKLNWIDFIY